MTVPAADTSYHKHLDVCAQCRDHPFALCAVGARLLESTASALAESAERYRVPSDLPKNERWVVHAMDFGECRRLEERAFHVQESTKSAAIEHVLRNHKGCHVTDVYPYSEKFHGAWTGLP
jgi:hypothetical protein